MQKFEWYEECGDSQLAQGDIIDDCPVIVPSTVASDGADAEVTIEGVERQHDVVVMTQSCDLEHDKVTQVLLCPIQLLSEYDEFSNSGNAEKLRRGEITGYHLLNRCELEGLNRELTVVSFRELFVLPKDYLHHVLTRHPVRRRLLPPYREHLSQAFARFFMRVGLPVDIPAFKSRP